MAMMNDLMRRIDAVCVATGGEGQDNKQKTDTETDPFRRAKKELHDKLKSVRDVSLIVFCCVLFSSHCAH